MEQSIPKPHEDSATGASRPSIINDVSAWVLRTGVIVSASVMLLGLLVSFLHGTVSLDRVEHARFTYNVGAIVHGIVTLHGQSIIEAGIYLLILTPIARVFMSMLLFVFAEKDWTYAAITLVVLVLTIAGLLWIG